MLGTVCAEIDLVHKRMPNERCGYGHTRLGQRSDLFGVQHQIMGWLDFQSATELVGDLVAAGWLQIFELAEQLPEAQPALFDGPDRILAKLPMREIEMRPVRLTHKIDDCVVPHPAAIQISGCNEERRRQA